MSPRSLRAYPRRVAFRTFSATQRPYWDTSVEPGSPAAVRCVLPSAHVASYHLQLQQPLLEFPHLPVSTTAHPSCQLSWSKSTSGSAMCRSRRNGHSHCIHPCRATLLQDRALRLGAARTAMAEADPEATSSGIQMIPPSTANTSCLSSPVSL